MSKTVSVLVVKPLTHQGRSYVRGDRVRVRAVEAAALRRKGVVTLTRGSVVEPPPPPPPDPEPRRRRTYRRRDLVAEPAAERVDE